MGRIWLWVLEKIHKAPYKGRCMKCGKRVFHYYPWMTSSKGKPLHDECSDFLFNEDEDD